MLPVLAWIPPRRFPSSRDGIGTIKCSAVVPEPPPAPAAPTLASPSQQLLPYPIPEPKAPQDPPYLCSGLPGFTRGFALKRRANLTGIKAEPGMLQGQPCLGTQLWGPLRDAASLKCDTGNSCQRKHFWVCWMKDLSKVPAFPLSV